MSLLKIRAKLYALGAIVLTVLGFLARIFFLKHQRNRARDAAEHYKAAANRARIVAEKHNEIEEQTRARRADALKELEDTGGSELFRDPNKLRDDTNN
jgi:Flp pilus assembly protein TadB